MAVENVDARYTDQPQYNNNTTNTSGNISVLQGSSLVHSMAEHFTTSSSTTDTEVGDSSSLMATVHESYHHHMKIGNHLSPALRSNSDGISKGSDSEGGNNNSGGVSGGSEVSDKSQTAPVMTSEHWSATGSPMTTPPGVANVLSYLYTGALPLQRTALCQMIIAANTLKLPGVVALCQALLTRQTAVHGPSPQHYHPALSGGHIEPPPAKSPVNYLLQERSTSWRERALPAMQDDGGNKSIIAQQQPPLVNDPLILSTTTQRLTTTMPSTSCGSSELMEDDNHREPLSILNPSPSPVPPTPRPVTSADIAAPRIDHAHAPDAMEIMNQNSAVSYCADYEMKNHQRACDISASNQSATNDPTKSASRVQESTCRVIRPTPTRLAHFENLKKHHEHQIHQQSNPFQLKPARPLPLYRRPHHPAILQQASFVKLKRRAIPHHKHANNPTSNNRSMNIAANNHRKSHQNHKDDTECSSDGEDSTMAGTGVASSLTRGSGGKVILDVAACDGPVFFERVLNRAYAGNATEDVDSDAEINVEELDSAEESPEHSVSKESAIVGNVARSDMEGVEMTGTLQPSTYHCVYCNHTFKSHYCYQKHMRRHINPITVEMGPKQMTITKEQTTVDNTTPLTSQHETDSGMKTTEDYEKETTAGTTMTGASSTAMGGKQQQHEDSGDGCASDNNEGGWLSNSGCKASNITTTNTATSQFSSHLNNSDANNTANIIPINSVQTNDNKRIPLNNQQPQSRGKMISPVKTALDLNVQYFPCKTCGCKFPSYYFVHKHRRLCHGGVEGEEAASGKVQEDRNGQ